MIIGADLVAVVVAEVVAPLSQPARTSQGTGGEPPPGPQGVTRSAPGERDLQSSTKPAQSKFENVGEVGKNEYGDFLRRTIRVTRHALHRVNATRIHHEARNEER